MSPELTITRDAEGPFAEWAAATWLTVTDDHPVLDELGDVPEVYFRLGLLVAMQCVAVASHAPDTAAARKVVAALEVAVGMLEPDPEPPA